jgi:CRP/FNR family cyclic AMP-dependent transcriptional regulator
MALAPSTPSFPRPQHADSPTTAALLPGRSVAFPERARRQPSPELLASLAQASLFASLREANLQELAALCQLRSFKPGQILFHEGDPGHALYLIRSGQVKIVRIAPDGQEILLRVAGPGECLGEMALLDDEPRSATLVALGPVEAVLLYREAFLELVEQQPGVALAVMAELTRKVRQMSEQVQDLMRLDVAGRIAKTLLGLAEEHGQVTPEGIRIGFSLSREEMAQMVGVARETVSRELMRWQERGVLTVERSGITLHQPEALEARIY